MLIRRSSLLLLILQSLLIVSGGAVRLTGSGLGCPTWPECTEGSWTPIASQNQLHTWIEFGNRLLTFALVGASATVLLAVWKSRKDLRWLAIWQVLGIFGQGILGGITVLTDLNPIPVAGHFILSILLIAGATSIFLKRNRPVEKISDSWLSKLHIASAFLVVLAGTVVTGSGPHAGDIKSPRFPFKIQNVAFLHADLVIAMFGITLALFVTAKHISKEIKVFLVVALAQGALGYVQYFTGVPEILVAFHMLGASLFWIFAWQVRFKFVTNQPIRSES
jgi:cytochrome c oxidase assembly protein subunit 15